ncbi:MAG: type II secretion system GspH family protein [Synergistaceae bacterium]|jgi:prepilin-type N-terminal cleavage/methylation domain-containing protein|nr:type II secretion system GspH family protein [Synergistaceae bacterium]
MRRGFTLMEVLVAVVIVGMTAAAGYGLIGVSLRSLAAADVERELVQEAQLVYMDFLTKSDMPDKGEKHDLKETDNMVRWSTDPDSIPVAEGAELTFRTLTVEYRDREMTLYLPDVK